MASTYTVNLGIEKIGTGEQSGTWGATTNTNFDLIDQAVNGAVTISLASAGSSGVPNTLAITDGASSNGRNKFIEFTDGGDLGATAYVQLTPNDAEKIVHMRNSLSGGRSVIVFQGTYNASNDFEIPNGKDVVLKFDGAGASATVTDVFAHLQATAITTPSLTATTADINGGTIDGATIGGASAAAGTFTNLTATGTTTLAGASTTADITFGDNDKAIFGAGSDLQIYHDGSASYIDDAGTGNLRIRANSSLSIQKYTGETMGVFTADGSVLLAYDNATKFETTATGIDVTGTVTADGLAVSTSSAVTAQLGRDGSDGDVLQIYNGAIGTTKALALGVDFTSGIIESQFGNIDIKAGSALAAKFASGGDISFYEDTGTTPKFFWDASEEVLAIGASSATRVSTSYGQITLNGASGGLLNFTDDGVEEVRVQSVVSDFYIQANGDTIFRNGGFTGGNEAMRIDSSGNLLVGTQTAATKITANLTSANDGITLRTTNEGPIGLLGMVNPGTNNDIEIGTLGANNLRFFTNGTANERMRLDSSGRLLVGTTAQGTYGGNVAELRGANISTLGGNVTGNLALFTTNSQAANVGAVLSLGGVYSSTTPYAFGAIAARKSNSTSGNAEGYLQFYTTDVTNAIKERMRIDSSGNVGIGTSSPKTIINASTSTGAILTLESSDTSLTTNDVIGGIDFYANDGSTNGTGAKVNIRGIATSTAGTITALTFGTSDSSSATATERMRIDGSGNVGIGTTSPLSKLSVQGDGLTVRLDGTANTSRGIFVRNTGASGEGIFQTDGNMHFLQEDASRYMRFSTANTERMRIDASGNLLVGTTSTGLDLSTNASGLMYTPSNFLCIATTVGGNSNIILNKTNSSAGTCVDIRYNGNIVGTIQNTASSTSYNTSSDYRLKDVDGPITNSGAYIDALKPVQGSWKADGSRFIGLIAHEVQEVSETQIATGEKDGEEMQGMDYSAPELIANLIAEIQSLRARVHALESK